MVVSPTDELKYQSATNGETDCQESKGPQNSLRKRGNIETAPRGETENDGNYDPSDRVIYDCCCDDDLTDIAAHEFHFANDDGNNLYGGD